MALGTLSQDAFAELHRALGKGAEAYAMGWIVPRATLLVHDGSNTRWYAGARLLTEANIGLVFTTNVGKESAATAAFDELMLAITERYKAYCDKTGAS